MVRAAFTTVAGQQEFLRNCQSGLDVRFEREGNPLGRFYREHRPALSAFLDEHREPAAVDALFVELAAALRASLGKNLADPVLAAVLHMHCNRVFAVDSRRLEFLTYELTARKIREYQAREAS